MINKNSEKTYDVVVVGAGPSGSTLGALLAENGLDILVIERERFPRQKLCGGCITWKTRKWLEEVFNISLSGHSSVQSICQDYFIYEKFREKVFQKSSEPFYFVDRKEYDQELANLAKKRGCMFLFGDRVIHFDVRDNVVFTESGHTYRGKIVVGADGATSVVRRKISRDNIKNYLALAFQMRVPGEKVKSKYRNTPAKLFVGGMKRGYSWIFPQGDNFLIGLWGSIKENKKLKYKYLALLSRLTEMDPKEKLSLPSCLAPSGYFMKEPGDKRVLLVGDAAGYVDPLTREGIYYAHKSAECASKAIIDYFTSNGKMDLIQSYKRRFLPVFKELIISRRLSNLAYSPLRYFAYFLNKPGFYSRLADIIHGKRKYSDIPLLSRWSRRPSLK